MQGRHQSRDRRRVGAWAVIVPLAVLACDCTRAQVDPAARRSAIDPMVLAADAIAIWEEGSARWVRLSGRAAAFQGLDGVRAAEAVVRIRPVDRPGRPSYRVDVFAEGEDGTLVPIITLGKNELVGEMAVLSNAPRSATLKAHGRVRTLRIDNETFLKLVTENAHVALHVMKQLSDKIANTTRLVERLQRELRRHGPGVD